MSIIDAHLDAAYGPKGQKPSDYALDVAFGGRQALSDPTGPLSSNPRLRRLQIQQRAELEKADAGQISTQAHRDLLAAAGGAAAGLLIPGGPEVTLAKGVMGALPGLAARAGIGALGGGAAAGVEAGIGGREIMPAALRGAAFGAPAGAIMGAAGPAIARRLAGRAASVAAREAPALEGAGQRLPTAQLSQALPEARSLVAKELPANGKYLAAFKIDGKVYSGRGIHGEVAMQHRLLDKLDAPGVQSGFVDSKGRFLTKNQTTFKDASIGQETGDIDASPIVHGAELAPVAEGAGQGLASAKLSQALPEAEGLITPVDRVARAVREAPALEPIQRRLYRVERGKRIGMAKEAAAGLKGEKAIGATLSKMKGELPKVDFESLRGKINDEDITSLIEQARNHPGLGFFESQITAPLALQKMFDGKLPTKGEISLLDDIFGSKLTSALLSRRSTLEKAKDLGIQVANVPREIMSSFDLSAPFRQGAFLIGRPKQFGQAFGSMFKYLGSERALKALEDNISARPTAQLMRESGLALTKSGEVLGKREEAFAGGLAQKIPILGHGIRASERAYTGFLNKLRADVFDDLVGQARKMGRDPNEVASDIASFVNNATGRGELPGGLEKAASELSTVFFSPRFMASRINLLNPLYYAKLDPFVRKEAIKSLIAAGSTAASIMGIAKMGGAEVAADPRDSDFGKIRMDNTRIDLLAGFGQWIRLGSRVATQDGKVGEIGRFLRYKESPIVAFAHNLLAGQTAIGEQVTLPGEAKRMLLPMIVQDVKDAYEEWGAPGLGFAAPAGLGLGVQTY